MWRKAINSPPKHMQNPGEIQPVLICQEWGEIPPKGREPSFLVRDFQESTERVNEFIQNPQHPAQREVIEIIIMTMFITSLLNTNLVLRYFVLNEVLSAEVGNETLTPEKY